MRNRFSYFLELVVLVPVFPILYIIGTKLKNNLVKLPPRSEFLKLESSNPGSCLLIIGESTAAGVGATSTERTFASHIFKNLKEQFTIINIGENGLKAENLQSLFRKSENEMPRNFSKTIILIGANDCFRFTPPGKFRTEIESFIHYLVLEKNVEKITIPLIPPVQIFPGIPKIMRFFLGWQRGILTGELEKLEKKLPHLSFENHGGKFAGEFFSEDGIHPSDMGYEQIASFIATTIEVKSDQIH